MHRPSKRLAVTAAGAGLAVAALAGVVVADPGGPATNDWPYANATAPADGASAPTAVLAAVGDISCEPDDPDNASTPAALKCGSPTLGGMDAQYATADQIESMHPDLVALLGDEQYEVGKLSDFEGSFDKSYGAFKFLQRPAPGNHEYYAYTKNGDHEAAQDGDGYFAYYNGENQAGAIRPQGQAGDYDKGWYSYNLGGWHVISLNIECNSAAFGNDCSTTDGGVLAQETQWLANDLKSDRSACTLAYWHQPTFSATTGGDAATAAAPGAGSQEGGAADAWWKLLYAAHADLVLNGHEHVYARFRPMDPTGAYDPRNGITQMTIGTGGEALDTLARNADGSFANPNVVTGQDQAFGVTKLTLTDHGYSWDYRPALVGPGADSSALNYSDSGSATCHAGERRNS